MWGNRRHAAVQTGAVTSPAHRTLLEYARCCDSATVDRTSSYMGHTSTTVMMVSPSLSCGDVGATAGILPGAGRCPASLCLSVVGVPWRVQQTRCLVAFIWARLA